MTEVGIRALKAKLSEYLALARRGERVLITENGRRVAEIVPVGRSPDEQVIWSLVDAGMVVWPGRKPKAPSLRVPIKGAPLAVTVSQDRDDPLSRH